MDSGLRFNLKRFVAETRDSVPMDGAELLMQALLSYPKFSHPATVFKVGHSLTVWV